MSTRDETSRSTDNRMLPCLKAFKRSMVGLALGSLAALSMPSMTLAANTDDSEVLVSGSSVPTATDSTQKPNVLFILDQSGSMNFCIPFRDTGSRRGRNFQQANHLDGDCDESESRIAALKDALSTLLSSEEVRSSINAGLMTFTGGPGSIGVTPIVYPMSDLSADSGAARGQANTGKTVATAMKELVESLQPDGATPIVDALYEAGLYLRGQEIFQGRGVSLGDSYPSSDIDSFTGGTAQNQSSRTETVWVCTRYDRRGRCERGYWSTRTITTETTCASTDIYPRCDYVDGSPTYKSPLLVDRESPAGADELKEACRNADYVILLTDGEPTINNSADEIRDLVNTDECQANSGGTHGECGIEMAEFLHEGDLNTDADGEQWVILNTIGFNLEDNEAAKDFLAEIAEAGGGSFTEASSADSLVDAFMTVLGGALDASRSFVAPALSVNSFNQLEHRDTVYMALFRPELTQRWKGNLKKYKVCTASECSVGTSSLTQGEYYDADNKALLDPQQYILSDTRSFWSDITDGGGDVSLGGAASQMPSPSDRKIYTFTGTYTDTKPTENSSIKSTADLTANENRINALTGAAATSPCTATASNNDCLLPSDLGETTATAANTLINWIKGVDVDNEDGNDTTTTRHILGDPMHSQPIVVSYGGNAASPLEKVIMMSNAGVLHSFDGETGTEDWAFIPQELLAFQKTVRANGSTPAGSRKYGLDGVPELWRNDANGDGVIAHGGSVADENAATGDSETDEFVALFFGQRDGGTSYWGLEMNPTATCSSATCTGWSVAPRLLWRITGGDGATAASDPYQSLANTWSQPKKTMIRVTSASTTEKPTHALVFGGGNIYEWNNKFGNAPIDATGGTNKRGNIVFIVDSTDGSLITSIGGEGTNAKLKVAGMDYPVVSGIALLDTDRDENLDRLYFGDLGGNVWRVDLKRTLSRTSTGSDVGFAAKLGDFNSETNTGGSPVDLKENTRAFYFEPTIVNAVDSTYSSTAEYRLILIGSGHRNNPKDTVVANRLYAIRDYRMGSLDSNGDGSFNGSDAAYSTVTESALMDVTPATFRLDARGAIVAPETDMTTIKSKQGYYIDLDRADGEKMVSRVRVRAGEMDFVTYSPITESGNACTPQEGTNRHYHLSVYSGASVYDFDPGEDNDSYANDGIVTLVNGGIADTPEYLFGENATTLLTPGPQGPGESIQLQGGENWHRSFWFQR